MLLQLLLLVVADLLAADFGWANTTEGDGQTHRQPAGKKLVHLSLAMTRATGDGRRDAQREATATGRGDRPRAKAMERTLTARKEVITESSSLSQTSYSPSVPRRHERPARSRRTARKEVG